MSKEVNRRSFLKKSLTASAGTTLMASFEEKALLAKRTEKSTVPIPGTSTKGLPLGKIGKVKISRLICGGNLINTSHMFNTIVVTANQQRVFDLLLNAEQDQHSYTLCWSDLLKNAPAVSI